MTRTIVVIMAIFCFNYLSCSESFGTADVFESVEVPVVDVLAGQHDLPVAFVL